ncbi:MAG TPA: hypothetical protein H9870_13530 [Candidatus Corynebacterium avicola]|uniref:Secreted protein n=1 Tax=Candidatus Corynebacterium avicola TaxID=2838527 RepID=A0A9D1UMD5_9CORY|nr:hypothetical protein [Candidatus Corynebacterium avicola]
MSSITRRLSASAAAVVVAVGTAFAVAPGASAQEDVPSESPAPADNTNILVAMSQPVYGPITLGSLASVMYGSIALCASDLTERPSNACF